MHAYIFLALITFICMYVCKMKTIIKLPNYLKGIPRRPLT